jgi:hypothetical protein
LPKCAAATINNCNLPEFTIGFYQNQNVNGTCDSGYVPQAGGSCSGTCTSDGSLTAHYSINVGCTQNTATCSASVRWMSGFSCPYQSIGSNGCDVGQTNGTVNCHCERTATGSSFSYQGSFICSNGSWTPGPGWTCNGNPSSPNQACQEVCSSGYEMVNGQCVPACSGAHEVRNGSGQCVCEANYERWPNNASGQCVAVCAVGLTRQADGQCGCNPGLYDWGADSGANRCQACIYPTADNIGFQCGDSPNICYVDARSCWESNTPGMAECECIVSKKNSPGNTPACLPIESQGVRYFRCQGGSWVRVPG